MKLQKALIISIILTVILSTTILAISSINQQQKQPQQKEIFSSSQNNQTNNNTENQTNVQQNKYLKQGKNNITTPTSFQPIYVKDFVKLYPEIEVISFKRNGKSIGFVNILNGIGENFIILPNEHYEIITKSNLTINEL